MSNNDIKVIIIVIARNAAATIECAIESILAQTYANWELHLVNNGSDDGTGAIMEQYRQSDSRIRVFTNEGNYVWAPGNNFYDYCKQYDSDSTFLCYLDADDEYKPDFLGCMVNFASENNLDIAACGYEKIDAVSGKQLEYNKSKEVTIHDGDEFAAQLYKYYNNVRSRCMKLFRLRVSGKLTVSDDFYMLYGGDTAESFEYFRNAERIGIYPEVFYVYYENPGSISFNWHSERILSDRKLYDIAEGYLISTVGAISGENGSYLASVYQDAIFRTSVILFKSKASVQEKFGGLYDILTCAHTKKALEFPITEGVLERRESFFQYAADWVAVQYEHRDDAFFDSFAEILGIMKVFPQSFPGWSEEEIIKLAGVFTKRYG